MTVITLCELLVGVMLPFGVATMRVGGETVETADDLQFFCRILPGCTLSQSVMFNSEMVKWIADRFYPFPPEGVELT